MRRRMSIDKWFCRETLHRRCPSTQHRYQFRSEQRSITHISALSDNTRSTMRWIKDEESTLLIYAQQTSAGVSPDLVLLQLSNTNL